MKERPKGKILRKGLLSTLSLLLALCSFLDLSSNVFAAEEYENIALNKPVTASKEMAGYEGKNIVDGSDKTMWQVDNIDNKPTVIIDLQKEQLISSIKLNWASNFAFKYKLYTARSNKVFSEVGYHEENTGGTNDWEMHNNAVVRYIKVELIQANTGNTTVGLNEVEVLQVKKTGPVNIALNKPAFSSGNEANLARLGPKGAFDGNYTDAANGRWSSQNITLNPQWIFVDLEEEKNFESINVLWQDAYAINYELQWSNDIGQEKKWTSILTVENGDGEWDKHTFNAINARFVRLYATKSNGIGSAKPISIWEMEIYEKVNNTLTVDDVAEKFSIGVITNEMKEMPTFGFDNDNIIASIFCSDTDVVVDDTGKINKPLVDKEVLVTYLIKDIRNGAEKEVRNQKVIIPGTQKVLESDNKAPVTVPSIQEWKGSVGTYKLNNTSRIVVQDENLRKAADITKSDIKDSFGYDLKIVDEAPQKGDIVLTHVDSDKTIGKQGYTMNIQDYITVSATTYQGVFYGTRSILQALTLNSTDFTINKGVARDYSKYEYRKFMLDVARKYIPMSYMKDFVKYLSYYKFSDIQVHLNDTSYNGHARFRLESDIEGLTASDGYYTKDEYRDFQYYAEDYGIRVISEFDTPAHSAVFVDLFPELGFDPNHLDIRLDSKNKDKVYEFISDLFDEYLGGDNPVIVTDAFNVGLDEYNANYKEDMTQYTKFVMELVHDKYGKTPLAWASMGCLDSEKTKIPEYPVMDAWANYAVNLKSLFNQDYTLINATNKYGYIVPGGNNGYPDFAKEEEIYNNLSAGKFRDKLNAGVDVAEGHPKIVGGSISLWNDRGIYNGISLTDVFARSKSIIPYYAQTYWYGKDQTKEFSEFKANITELGDGPNVNIRSTIESKSELVYDFDIESTKQSNSDIVIKDNSGNNYDAKVINGEVINDSGDSKIEFKGNGHIEMKHKALTWPNSILFDINIDKKNTQDIILFEETRPKEECDKKIDTKYNVSKVYLKKIGDKYQLMFDREGYHYEHSYKFGVDKAYKVGITSDYKNSSLIVDGKIVSSINGPILTNSGNKWSDSASLEIPLQKVGKNLYGELDNIKLFNRVLSLDEVSEAQEIVSIQSLTTNKKVSVSSLDAPANGTQNGENAVDGDPASRWTSNRADGNFLTESIVVDLNDTYKVNRVEIDWEDACAKEYTVQVSTDGKDWTTVSTITNGVKENRVIKFGAVNAKFIKLEFTKKVSNKYGYSIYEIRAFENPNTSLINDIADAEKVLTNLKNVGMYEGQINKEVYDKFSTRLADLKAIANKEDILTDEKLIEYKTEIKRTVKNLPNNIVKIELEAINSSIKKIEGLSKRDYGKTQYNLAQDELTKAKDMLTKPYTQKMIDDMSKNLEVNLVVLNDNKIDRTSMGTLIENSSVFNEVDYTKLSWKEFKNAYDTANLMQTKDDVEKDAFDTCYMELKTAISKLELVKENNLDYSKLEKEIEVSKRLKEENYTVKSWRLFATTLIKAETILKNGKVGQDIVDSMVKDLKKVREALVEKPTIDIKPDGNIVIKDLENNITIIGKLSKDAQLIVKSLTGLELEELKAKLNKVDPQFLTTTTLENVFDIELLINNQKYIFDGTIKVIMKLDANLRDKSVGIIHIDNQGRIVKLKSMTDGEYIYFEVPHLSTYAIVSYKDKNDIGVGEKGKIDIPITDDNTIIGSYMIALSVLGGLCVLLRKRKSKKVI